MSDVQEHAKKIVEALQGVKGQEPTDEELSHMVTLVVEPLLLGISALARIADATERHATALETLVTYYGKQRA